VTAGHYHCSVKGVGRGTGAGVMHKAAYRAGERLYDERGGTWTADYRKRARSVIGTFIVTRATAAAWRGDRQRLWNAAEAAEPRRNGRIATELELALPHELSAARRKELLTGFLAAIVDRHGVAADVAIHAAHDDRNIHAHVLLTHRELGPDGFGEIANTRILTRRRKGRDAPEKVAGIAATPADIEALRKAWAGAVNRAYAGAGLEIRVDHRSHEERGIAEVPTVHLGPKAAGMERRQPGSSERGTINREIARHNARLAKARPMRAEARRLTQRQARETGNTGGAQAAQETVCEAVQTREPVAAAIPPPEAASASTAPQIARLPAYRRIPVLLKAFGKAAKLLRRVRIIRLSREAWGAPAAHLQTTLNLFDQLDSAAAPSGANNNRRAECRHYRVSENSISLGM
jgi:MobA/MobL family